MVSKGGRWLEGGVATLLQALALLLVLFAATFASSETPSLVAPEDAVPAATPTPEAAFGLTWFSSKEDVSSLVGPLGKPMATQFGDSYVASTLPKSLTDLHYAVLSFDSEGRLVRIVAVGGAFMDDYSGAHVKGRYEELKTLLRKKYGEGQSIEHTDPGAAGDGWGLGLYLKKNWLSTVFEPTDVRIELSVFQENGRNNWRMIFEHVPSMRRLEQQKKESDKEAF